MFGGICQFIFWYRPQFDSRDPLWSYWESIGLITLPEPEGINSRTLGEQIVHECLQEVD